MSIEITATIKCDGCGATIHGKVQNKVSCGLTAYWSAKSMAEKARWMFLQRYGTARHLCQKCADGRGLASRK